MFGLSSNKPPSSTFRIAKKTSQYTAHSELPAAPTPMARHPLVGQGLLIDEASRLHSDTPHSLGLLWTSDQPDALPSTWQHNTHK